MLAEHPHVAPGTNNETLGLAVKQAMYCAAICNSCVDACVAEPLDMRQCIRLCSDCADVCTATYRVGSRRTGGDRQLIRSLLATCIEVSTRCADECEFHGDTHGHCRRCAAMCRDCADACRAALVVLNEEAHRDSHHVAH
jgi:hypothetical protein